MQDKSSVLLWPGSQQSVQPLTLYLLTSYQSHDLSSNVCNRVCVGFSVGISVAGVAGFVGVWLWRRYTGRDRKDEKAMARKMRKLAKMGKRQKSMLEEKERLAASADEV